jgi:hypothetical protein
VPGRDQARQYLLQFFIAYTYSALPGPRYIRLIHLEPSSGDLSKLNASLKVHSLDDLCEHEAISYTWGNGPESDRGMILVGLMLGISRNLYATLMAFSHADRTRVMWADAICINQTDTAEKVTQISTIAEIYSKTDLVPVSLAPASIAGEKGMKFFTQLASQAKAFCIGDDVGHPRL